MIWLNRIVVIQSMPYYSKLAFVLAMSCACLVAQSERADFTPGDERLLWSSCFTTLRVPEYPPIARQAGMRGRATVVVRAVELSQPLSFVVTGVSPILKEAVRTSIEGSTIRDACQGRMIELLFEFTIEGSPSEMQTKGAVVFMAPNEFVITVPPTVPQESSTPGH